MSANAAVAEVGLKAVVEAAKDPRYTMILLCFAVLVGALYGSYEMIKSTNEHHEKITAQQNALIQEQSKVIERNTERMGTLVETCSRTCLDLWRELGGQRADAEAPDAITSRNAEPPEPQPARARPPRAVR